MNEYFVVIGSSMRKLIRCFLWLLFSCSAWMLFAGGKTASAADIMNSLGSIQDPLDVDPDYSFLYDTRSIGLDKDGRKYLFEGDVVLIGGGNVITADKIEVDYTTSTLTGEGHVVLLHQNQVFTGQQIELQWKSGDFTIKEALLVANDKRKVEQVSRQILGQTSLEIDYEAAREQRLLELQKRKDDLLREQLLSPDAEPREDQVTALTRLLERENFTRQASPPSMADRNLERRRRLQRRRDYWKKSRAESALPALPGNYYFRLQGDVLQRREGNRYRLDRGLFTPCFCADDELPAWGFEADQIDAEQEGYVDLRHPVLTIKGIPILYLPYLKLPMKMKRQSGFLMPSFRGSAQRNGFVYSQPVFFDLGPAADTTVTTDLIEKRGTRLGFEARYEARQYSGIRLQTELIRDKAWLQTLSQRQGLMRYYLLDQPSCNQTDPSEKLVCEKQVRENLSPPDNTWRGKEEWQARYFLAPRLSIVSAGKVLSDHRYIEDLYLPEDLVTAFASQANANAFSTAKSRLDFDGKDFYLGMGHAFGDNVLSSERYSGEQIPAYLSMRTRLFRLLPESWLTVPIYADISMKSFLIETQDKVLNQSSLSPQRLGDGSWQRFAAQLTTPLNSEGAVRVDHFAEGELRVVRHEDLPSYSSSIRSWRTGLNLNLPIDGVGPLPSWLVNSAQADGSRYVRHIMNWGLSLSLRPSVVRAGPYGELNDAAGAPLVYFQSDRKRFYIEDRDVKDEDTMVPHQRVTLSSSHRWQLFDRVMERIPDLKKTSEAGSRNSIDDLHKQALDELRSVKNRALLNADPMAKDRPDGGLDKLINRYQSRDINLIEPINFSTSLSFDYQQETLRQQQVLRNQEIESEALLSNNPDQAAELRSQKLSYYSLPESWLGPYTNMMLNYRGFSLNTSSIYNMYRNSNTTLSIGVGLPRLAETSVAMTYVLENNPELDSRTDTLLFKRIRTTNFGLSSNLVPYVTIGMNLIRKQVESDQIQYASSYQIAYDSLSGCWGLRFVREKDLNQNEEDANYIVQLAVIFLGNRRSTDISPGIKKELGMRTTTQ